MYIAYDRVALYGKEDRSLRLTFDQRIRNRRRGLTLDGEEPENLYFEQGEYTKNFVVTLLLLPALVQAVIMLVNGNLGTGVAIMGAFSLVRFRSVPGTSREISGVFYAIVVGLATGMGYLAYAAMIDDIRTRNANLTVNCSRVLTSREEL